MVLMPAKMPELLRCASIRHRDRHLLLLRPVIEALRLRQQPVRGKIFRIVSAKSDGNPLSGEIMGAAQHPHRGA
jgi:hypothetical protein